MPGIVIALAVTLVAGVFIGGRYAGTSTTPFAFAASESEPPEEDDAVPSSGDQAGEVAEDGSIEACLSVDGASIRERIRDRLAEAFEDVPKAERDDPDDFDFDFDFDPADCLDIEGLDIEGHGGVVISGGRNNIIVSGTWDDEALRNCLADEGIDIPSDAESVSIRIATEDGEVTAELRVDDEVIETDADLIESALRACHTVQFPDIENFDPEDFDLDGRFDGDNFPFGEFTFDFGENFPFGDDHPFASCDEPDTNEDSPDEDE